MVDALIEVLKDLLTFVMGGSVKSSARHEIKVEPVIEEKFDDDSHKIESAVLSSVGILDGNIAYVCVEETLCLSRPVLAFDTVLGTLHYGEKVSVQDIRGFFAYGVSEKIEGWFKVEDLVDVKSSIFPTFRPGYQYNSRNEETIKLRHLIKDTMLGGKLSLSLQPEELTYYLLQESGVRVHWSSDRPRKAGSWQNILKGSMGVTIGIEPKTGAVMETTGNESDSFIGVVSEVKPDSSIKLVTIGRELDGEYREEVFDKNTWIEWRPVFISFT